MTNLPLTPLGGARGWSTFAHQAVALSRSRGFGGESLAGSRCFLRLGPRGFFFSHWEVSKPNYGDENLREALCSQGISKRLQGHMSGSKFCYLCDQLWGRGPVISLP